MQNIQLILKAYSNYEIKRWKRKLRLKHLMGRLIIIGGWGWKSQKMNYSEGFHEKKLKQDVWIINLTTLGSPRKKWNRRLAKKKLKRGKSSPCLLQMINGKPPRYNYSATVVQDTCAISMVTWEIIAGEFLTVPYISMNTLHSHKFAAIQNVFFLF